MEEQTQILRIFRLSWTLMQRIWDTRNNVGTGASYAAPKWSRVLCENCGATNLDGFID